MCTEMSGNTQLWFHQISHHPKTVRVEQIRASGTDEGFCIQANLCVCVAAVKRFLKNFNLYGGFFYVLKAQLLMKDFAVKSVFVLARVKRF